MIKPIARSESRRAENDRSRRAPREWNPDRVLKRLSSQPLDERMLSAAEGENSAVAHVLKCVALALPETPAHSERIQADLKRAGDYQPLAPQKLATIRYVGMIVSLVVFGTLTLYVSPQSEPWSMAALLIGMLAAWWLPVWHLQRRASRRTHAIELGIPDLLDLLRVCASQGLTVPVALATASRELRPIHPAIADELAIVCRQAELTSLAQALEAFETRVDLPEIRSLVTQLLETDMRPFDQPALVGIQS
jgi:tight adherence protein C